MRCYLLSVTLLQQAWSANGVIVFCPSVCSDEVYCSYKQCILYSKRVWASKQEAPPKNTILHNFQPRTPTLTPQTPNLLKLKRWCRLAITLKIYCEQANRQNFHVWNSHRQHAACLFQAAPYDRPSLSNSWATCHNSLTWGSEQWINNKLIITHQHLVIVTSSFLMMQGVLE